MPVAEIIAIGTELLLGEITDTNTRFIARRLRENGVDLLRTSMVGDNAERIALAIHESLSRADFVITTGGLGPTVDDPTRLAVAKAAGVELEYRPELWDQILDRFRRYSREPSENNRRQAYIPQGSQPLENQVGTAPAFITTIAGHFVISLPGVPGEMEWLMGNLVLPFLHETYNLHEIIQVRVLHLAGLGESMVDERISELELLANPTIGLSAHAGQVDIRITAKADSPSRADSMIAEIESDIRHRMGDYVYGADADTLAGVILQITTGKNLNLALVDCGTNGELTRRLVAAGFPAANSRVISTPAPELDPETALMEQMQKSGSVIGLSASFLPGQEQQSVHILVISPNGRTTTTRTYGGAPANGIGWSVNTALDALRRTLLTIKT
jgi:nicotinamide-nucleotide amidase